MSSTPTQAFTHQDVRSARPTTEHVSAGTDHAGHGSHLKRHFFEMLAVMVVGMIASAAIFLTAVRMTWEEATVRHPMASLLVVAAGMSVPMAAWMLHRGMGRRNSAEMAAVMVVPVLPFLCLVWFNVTKSAWCGPYCVVTIIAMLGLMLHRRKEYSGDGGAR
jgi:hypothetical protein